MTRVWLTSWEWACCGEPFEIGDEVDFGIRSRDPEVLVDELGAELTGTVDALESHHEEEYADRVRGRVVAVHEASREVVERRFEHFVDPFARARPSGRMRLPDGVSAGARFSRQGSSIERVPGTTRLSSVGGIPVAAVEHHGPSARPADAEESPAEERRRQRVGWLVDIEETPSAPRIA
ncbi:MULTISPECIES: DUF6578 domain-containing protein [unclassified Microbacterium]|uniref:DUF6578 domain-containing protein n=1 Tax=unclassified Microbacterium TaxID=2609290 RepID=UPI000CFD6C21|nr:MULTISPECIES: DUF6578 domain-containing protein [unclassified Microbacterium]PQZ53856.1 hypothetical protein CQ032_14355 [Microbacterium sp. MYb43]PQZ76805.1 hypothetical protein CQ031_12675 [Microbacterium sp. MYb40]PRB21076.1 hypothetical protein CQ040_09685 [Microbacterium sp. MYb54]PRB25006.1 hypothetical protein CQ037_15485 [Microbacterium sp. MYb50]PRB66896.1 hypothetical protein CQ021_09375 [Microbacterium sp. MYb24]